MTEGLIRTQGTVRACPPNPSLRLRRMSTLQLTYPGRQVSLDKRIKLIKERGNKMTMARRKRHSPIL